MQYEIIGNNFPAVTLNMSAGDVIQCEAGAMLWMDPSIEMETSGGGIGKMFGRMFSGESIFLNKYTAHRDSKMTLGACVPGQILPVVISSGNDLIVQKDGFLAAELGVDLSAHVNKKIGNGVFGGEGFVMQKLSGNGQAFIQCDGSLAEVDLAAGQELLVGTGHLLAFEASVSYEIQQVKGVFNKIAGGEGLFNIRLVGPGKTWLQTMPISSLAGVLKPFIVTED